MGDHGDLKGRVTVSNKSRRNPSGGNRKPPARSGSGNPSGRGKAAPEPQGSSARRTLERYSARPLVTLHSLPRWLVPVALAILLFVGLLLSGPWGWLGALFLIVIGLFVTWLTALSWPILTPSSRAVRVVVAVVLFGLAILKALGRW